MKYWIFISGILLASGVLIGAMGNHYFADLLNENQGKEAFFRGHFYYMVHAVGILISVLIAGRVNPISKYWNIPPALFLIGIFLFSGSLFLKNTGVIESTSFAPIGGISFMLGWLCLGIIGLRER